MHVTRAYQCILKIIKKNIDKTMPEYNVNTAKENHCIIIFSFFNQRIFYHKQFSFFIINGFPSIVFNFFRNRSA